MKIKIKILTTAFFLANSFSVFSEDIGHDAFSGCVGKDVTGREVKVESLSRNLENCPFAKVYLKENEEKYKSEIDSKVSDVLKTSLDQDLETLMLQGEFFDSLGINLLSYGDNEDIKANCKLDKMTDLSTCPGKNEIEYERRKNALFEKFGARNEAEFSQKIKDKFKRMTGRGEGISCPLISNNEKDLDQFLLYQSSFTKASLVELKSYLKEGDLREVAKKFPMLDLIFKGDEKTAKKFIEEIKGLDESKGESVLAGLIKDKIKNFYGLKENAKSISATMAKTCGEFNKKITKFICSDDLKYETQNSTLSRRLFEGFDMSEADLSRNRRVKLQDKEMAFMAFGKKCEITDREEKLDVAQNKLNLDKLIGSEGEYVKGIRGEILDDEIISSKNELKEIAFCQTPDLKSKNLCSDSLPLSAAKLREAYNCPDDKSCENSIELAANYLEGCEKREARNRKLAAQDSGNNNFAVKSASDDLDLTAKDSLDLDFFDNLLTDTKVPQIKSFGLQKKTMETTQKADIAQTKNVDGAKKSLDPYAPKTKKPDSLDRLASDNNSVSPSIISGAIRTSGSDKYSDKSALKNQGPKIEKNENQKLSAVSSVAKITDSSGDDSVSKVNAELMERMANLEGQIKGKKEGYKSGYEEASKEFSKTSRNAQEKESRNSKKSNETKFNDSVYRNNQVIADNSGGVIDSTDFPSVDSGEGSTKGGNAGGNEAWKNGSRASSVSKASGLSLNSQIGKKDDNKNGGDLVPALVLNLEELGVIDEIKLNQLWKDKNSKFIINIKGDKNLDEKMILSIDKNKKPTIDNFQMLSVKTRESVLKSKLFKDFKIIRQKELNDVIKKAI